MRGAPRWHTPFVIDGDGWSAGEDVLSHHITARSRCTIYWTRLQPSILQNFHFWIAKRDHVHPPRARRVSSCSMHDHDHEVMENALRALSGMRDVPNRDVHMLMTLTVPDADASPTHPVVSPGRRSPVVLVHRPRVHSLQNSGCFTRFSPVFCRPQESSVMHPNRWPHVILSFHWAIEAGIRVYHSPDRLGRRLDRAWTCLDCLDEETRNETTKRGGTDDETKN